MEHDVIRKQKEQNVKTKDIEYFFILPSFTGGYLILRCFFSLIIQKCVTQICIIWLEEIRQTDLPRVVIALKAFSGGFGGLVPRNFTRFAHADVVVGGDLNVV